MKSTDDTFVFGDCHGHLDRLEGLLKLTGLIYLGDDGKYKRTKDKAEVEIVQLGDLGHFGMDRGHNFYDHPTVKSPTEDWLCYELARDVIDVVLWGNHDRAVISNQHHFGGYVPPIPETFRVMQEMMDSGKLRLAHSKHGFFFTHAGLHKQWKICRVPEEWKSDPAVLAEVWNAFDKLPVGEQVQAVGYESLAIMTNVIGGHRGGGSPYGGILWRDAGESLYDGFRQIFGHSSKDKVRQYNTKAGASYCIDVGNADNGKLVGMWLPSEIQVHYRARLSTDS